MGCVNGVWHRSGSPLEAKFGCLSWSASPTLAHPPPPLRAFSPNPSTSSLSRSGALPTLRHSAMVRSKITYYAMLMPERRYEIQQ